MSEKEVTSKEVASEQADKGAQSPVEKVAEEEVHQLTRKRTRDDFEHKDEEESSDEDTANTTSDRPSTELKRQKSNIDTESESVVADDKPQEKAIPTIEEESTTKNEDKDEEKSKNEDGKDNSAVTETKPEEKKEDNVKKVTEEKVDSKAEEKTEDKAEETKPEVSATPAKPKFVFGSTTPFGANAFSMINKKKNVFESSSSDSVKPAASTTSSVFGSNSTFGNAFQSAVKKPSIFEKKADEGEEKANNGESTDKEGTSTSDPTPSHLYKQVDLEKKDIKSGEEDEIQVFTCRAKLYTLDLTNVKEGWKERGVGNIHVNQSKNSENKSRIIMRSIGLLKVILNTPLVAGLDVVKGMPSSLSSEKFIRITSVEDGKPVQYALKTGNVELTNSLFEEIEKLIPKSV